MAICNGCGGVLGVDCFNARECEQITASMANYSARDDGYQDGYQAATQAAEQKYAGLVEAAKSVSQAYEESWVIDGSMDSLRIALAQIEGAK